MTAHARRPHDGARQIFLHAHSSVSVHATLCSSHTKQGVLCPAIQSASVRAATRGEHCPMHAAHWPSNRDNWPPCWNHAYAITPPSQCR